MIDAPRVSSLGEILDRTAQIYRTRFLVFFGIALVPTGVVVACAVGVFLFFAWMGTSAQTASDSLVGIVAVGFLAVCALVLLPLCAAAAGLGSGALNHAATAVFHNQNMGIREAYRAAWKRGWHYIWLLILQGIAVVAAPAVVWLAVLAAVAVTGGVAKDLASGAELAGVAVLLVALAVYALWMLLLVCLAFPACVVEKMSAWRAVRRAISLSKGTRSRILVLYLLGLILGCGLSLLLMVPAVLLVSFIPSLNTPQHAQFVGMAMLLLMYAGQFAVRAFIKPVYAIAEMLVYFDQRIRKEGFDIEWMMRQAGMMELPVQAPVYETVAEIVPQEPSPAPAAEMSPAAPGSLPSA